MSPAKNAGEKTPLLMLKGVGNVSRKYGIYRKSVSKYVGMPPALLYPCFLSGILNNLVRPDTAYWKKPVVRSQAFFHAIGSQFTR